MVRINGVDQVILDRIKARSQKRTVFEADGTKVTEDKDQRERKGGEQKPYSRKSLEEALEDLNSMLQEEGSPVRFEKVTRNEVVYIRVMDSEKGVLLSEITPEKILKLLNEINRPSGFVVDRFV